MRTNSSNGLLEQFSHKKWLLRIWYRLHIDPALIFGVFAVVAVGLMILYSAGNQSSALMSRQLIRLCIAFSVMILFAQISPRRFYQWVTPVFCVGVLLLLVVLVIGHIGKGAQRWLNLGVVRFQPSEIMKIAVPMMVAKYLHDKSLPPRFSHMVFCAAFILVPVVLTAKQPDLGTAIMILSAGAFVLLLSGLTWHWMVSAAGMLLISFPVAWHFLHSYQKERVWTFLNPERDPLGSGYHIIQSKIAIGSGGFFGKGWLHGTQSHLQFLPEHATDFIFAVLGEEFGFIGCFILLMLLLTVVARGLYISTTAQDTFSRLLAGSISLTFFFSFFINIGMVTGILPVVGIPLPLVSYGGTSMVTLMAGLGILMSITTHRKLLAQ